MPRSAARQAYRRPCHSRSGGLASTSESSLHDEDAGFAAEFVRGKAQMQWSAVVGDYHFQSDPLNTSSSDFAEIGTMRNGTFFRGSR